MNVKAQISIAIFQLDQILAHFFYISHFPFESRMSITIFGLTTQRISIGIQPDSNYLLNCDVEYDYVNAINPDNYVPVHNIAFSINLCFQFNHSILSEMCLTM